jgi:hypothetical protein
MLVASIRHLIPVNHNTLADIMIAVAQHIEADRAAHCRHVTAGEYYTPRNLPTAHPNASGPSTPGRAAGVSKRGK